MIKKNYILKIFVLALLFGFKYVSAQNNLADNQYGPIIQNWLDAKKDNYNLTANDISDLQVSDAYYSKKTEINHVYVNQAYQGVKIHNAISSVAIKDNSIFYYANALISNISSKVNTTSASLNPQTAINAVVSEYNLGVINNLEALSTSDNSYLFSNGGVSKENIPVQLVYQLVEDGTLKLAWDLSIYTNDAKNWYSVRVDAVTGVVLDTNNWVLSCNFGDGNHINHSNHKAENTQFDLFSKQTFLINDGSQYNVFPIPTESPNHGPIQVVTEPSNDVASPFGWHDTNGVAGAEFTITRGNNVHALEDQDANSNTVGLSPDGGATLNFNFPFNENQDPIGFLDVSTTNLFYMNNIMHDVFYQYGFDEVSGNFQENNYGNGGVQGDSVLAEGQDGGGLSNANFATPPDGNTPRMQMFLWTAQGPPGQPLTVNNSTVAGNYIAAKATFGAALTLTPVTADLTLVTDNNAGTSTDENDACDIITNTAAIAGKIAVLRRGGCQFGVKVLAAENAGAIAVIVVNNLATAPTQMTPGTVGDQVTIPSIMVGQADGEAIINALINGETINASLLAAAPFQRDGSIDNGLIAHEYGHGISTRLAGGPGTSGCLGNAEQMGEGWSDWFGLMVTIKSGDLGDDARALITYSLSQPITGSGSPDRPFRYSIDTSENPLTYGNTNAGTTQPHGIGSVWATMLWDLTWRYIDKYGFDSDIYNGTGGNNRVIQLVLDGLKLQPCNAGFVTARDALLAADQATTNGEDACMIWEVFAARGVGLNADQGTFGSRSDQTEDFTMPPLTDPTLQNCSALSVDEFALNSQYSIYPNPANNILNIKVKKNFGEVMMTLTDINGRRVLSKTTNLSDETQLNISALQSGIYILNIKGENINTNDKILKN